MAQLMKAISRVWARNESEAPAKVDLSSCPAFEQRTFIEQSIRCREAIARFVGTRTDETSFVSLGENCSTAWYLKQVGLKEASYPFDWVFSSPEIVIDCIESRFETYLDRKRIVEKRGRNSAGHADYHTNFFHHRSPLESEDDYSYYSRCCSRFLALLQSKRPTFFVITLINEPSKRLAWSTGFNERFPRPDNQDATSLLQLMKKLKGENLPCRFVVIDHRTNGEQGITANIIDEDLIFVRFLAAGGSTGVFYENYLDDFCFKVAMTGLYGEL